MMKVARAKKIILKELAPLKETETLNITLCLNRAIARDIKAKEDIPPFNNSAMDGFAVRAEDLRGVSRAAPKILKVVADLPAGRVVNRAVGKGEVIRIMTGAPMPKGADAVVMVEDTQIKSQIPNPKSQIPNSKQNTKEYIEIFKEVAPGENLRCAGEDVRRGSVVIKKGTALKPGHIGMLAALGVSSVNVVRRPKVAILATGDELLEVNERLTPGKIRNSNAYSLYAQTLSAGGLPILLGIARDTRSDLERKIKAGLNKSDMLLVSGGISVGAYDFVKEVLADLGADMKFWKVAMRPGKPLAFGMIDGIPVFGLPGNPVSSMVSFEAFVRPVIVKMLGKKEADGKEVRAVTEEDIHKKKGFTYFLRAQTRWQDGFYITRTTGPQGSGILNSFVRANSLIILPEDEEFIPKGRKVTVRLLD